MPNYCGKQNSKNEILFVQNMAGYLFYDFIHKFYFGLITTKILFGQHFLGMICCLIVLINKTSGVYFVYSVMLIQFSNIWMLCRVVLRQMGLRYSLSYEYVHMLNILTLNIGSLIFGPALIYFVYECTINHPVFRHIGFI